MSIEISFTREELEQLKPASEQWLTQMANLERKYNIKILDTITTCASAHRKILTALGEK